MKGYKVNDMNVNETEKFKGKLEEVLNVVDEYGKQSKQLAQAKGTLGDLAAVLEKTCDTVAGLISECDTYLQSAKNIVSGECFEKVSEQIEDARKIVAQIKDNEDEFNQKQQEILLKYVESIKLLEGKTEEIKSILATVEDACSNVNDKIQNNDNKVDTVIKEIQLKSNDLLKCIKDIEINVEPKIAEIIYNLRTLAENSKVTSAETKEVILKNNEKIVLLLESHSNQLQELKRTIDEKEAKTQNVIIENGEKLSPLFVEVNEQLKILKEAMQKQSDVQKEQLQKISENISELFINKVSEIKSESTNALEKINLKFKKIILGGSILFATTIILLLVALFLK